jgi:hypothetical protein
MAAEKMDNLREVVPLFTLLLVLLVIVGFFIRTSIRLRRGGGSLTTVVLGTADESLTQDRSKAAETIVNENAGKKFERQSSRLPKDSDTSGPQDGDTDLSTSLFLGCKNRK